MSLGLATSSNYENAENIPNEKTLQNQVGSKKSYLVFRKDGGKLTILHRSCQLKERQSRSSSNIAHHESNDQEDIVFETVTIKQEEESYHEHSVGEIDQDLHSLLNDSDSSSDLDLNCSNPCGEAYSSVCEVCGLKFKGHNALASHRKWKHTNVIKHECKFCGRTFRDSFCLKRHLTKVHTKDGNIRENFRSLHCIMCSFKASEGSLIAKHYSTAHGYNMTEEKMRFPNLKEFNVWKKQIEHNTKSRFVKARGSRLNRNGTTVAQFHCHRSGFYYSVLNEKRKRSLKSSGSNKINGFCPASISYIEFRGQIIVKYVPTHVGHSLDVKKLSLTDEEKEFIAEKLINKVPMDRILEDLTESVSNPQDKNRINLTTRKDFYNIIQKFNLKKLAVYSQFKNEWKKFDFFVEELKEKSNVVRFYKPLGKLIEEYSEFKSEDFCLIIASDEQLEMLKLYGNNCICIDNVFKVNINDFELYTVMILDEIRQSFPCAFIFSSRVDDNALRVYFRKIKSIIDCEICPRHFVSDWANSIYNAWTSVFEEAPGRNMFTCMHIEREWQKNLNKIKSKDKQIEVFNKIKVLLNLRNFSEFEESSKRIVKELSYNYETKIYSNYFQKFLCEPQTWASCYRLNAEINKSLNIDELYSNIEYFIVKNKKVKCLTKTAQALMNYASIKCIQRTDIPFREKLDEKMSQIVSRHRLSLELQESIIEITDQGWNVISIDGDVEYKYLVFKDDYECTCTLICPECSVCIHAYSCTCSDATDDLNMCQHIHLIVLCLQNNMLTEKVNSPAFEVQVTNGEVKQESTFAADSNISESEYIESQVDGEYQISVMCEDENGTYKPPAQFEAKKCEFIERLTTIVNGIETEEELDAVILQNSPLEEILQNVKGKKKYEAYSEELGDTTERVFYDQSQLIFEGHVDMKQEYPDEVLEAEQIALEVILES